MPSRRIAERAHFSSDPDESLRSKAAFMFQDLALRKQASGRKHDRLIELMEDIYASFFAPDDPDWEIPDLLPAVDFNSLNFRGKGVRAYSRPTVIKAKKLLGIRSKKVGNVWYWTTPTRAPHVSLQALHDKYLEDWTKKRNKPYQTLKAQLSPSVMELQSIMTDFLYDAINTEVLSATSYSRKVIIRAKAQLGIVSIKARGEWHWVYPAPEVQEWLLEQLSEGPRVIADLIDLAIKRGWSSRLVHSCKAAVRGIVFCRVDDRPGEAGWRLI